MFLPLNKTFISPFPSIWINFIKSLIMKKNTSKFTKQQKLRFNMNLKHKTSGQNNSINNAGLERNTSRSSMAAIQSFKPKLNNYSLVPNINIISNI